MSSASGFANDLARLALGSEAAKMERERLQFEREQAKYDREKQAAAERAASMALAMSTIGNALTGVAQAGSDYVVNKHEVDKQEKAIARQDKAFDLQQNQFKHEQEQDRLSNDRVTEDRELRRIQEEAAALAAARALGIQPVESPVVPEAVEVAAPSPLEKVLTDKPNTLPNTVPTMSPLPEPSLSEQVKAAAPMIGKLEELVDWNNKQPVVKQELKHVKPTEEQKSAEPEMITAAKKDSPKMSKTAEVEVAGAAKQLSNGINAISATDASVNSKEQTIAGWLEVETERLHKSYPRFTKDQIRNKLVVAVYSQKQADDEARLKKETFDLNKKRVEAEIAESKTDIALKNAQARKLDRVADNDLPESAKIALQASRTAIDDLRQELMSAEQSVKTSDDYAGIRERINGLVTRLNNAYQRHNELSISLGLPAPYPESTGTAPSVTPKTESKPSTVDKVKETVDETVDKVKEILNPTGNKVQRFDGKSPNSIESQSSNKTVRMKLPNGKIVDVPLEDVEEAKTKYNAKEL